MGLCESSARTEIPHHPQSSKPTFVEGTTATVAPVTASPRKSGATLFHAKSPPHDHTAVVDARETAHAFVVSRRIEEQLQKDSRSQEKIVKLLLLGPSMSGKSTVLKQIRIIHMNGFSNLELQERRPLIIRNVFESVHQLIAGMRALQLPTTSDIEENIERFTTYFSTYDFTQAQAFPAQMVPVVKELWSTAVFQQVYDTRSDVFVLDAAKYFLDAIERIGKSDYTPVIADVLHARQQTTGVSEMRYNYKELEFRIYDVGGQKSNRRKWLHLFDNCTAVFFVAAISEYDQFMIEDQATNRLLDALHLFKWIGNNDYFAKVQMILFLNKKDIFAEKIGKIPLTVVFPSYRYKNDYKNGTAYIQRKFEHAIKSANKMLYTHFTCATDTDQVTFLLNSVTDMIIAENFKQTGVI